MFQVQPGCLLLGLQQTPQAGHGPGQGQGRSSPTSLPDTFHGKIPDFTLYTLSLFSVLLLYTLFLSKDKNFALQKLL